MRTKVTYIISNINKALSFEWTAELIDKEKIELSFILLNPGISELETFLIKNNFKVYRINYNSKFSLPKAILLCILYLIKIKPNVIHTHLFEANLVGLLSGWLCGIKKRIQTRHHSSFHHDYFPKMIKYDRLCNYFSTDIIAPTNIVKEILIEKESVAKNKIHLIHHGFKLDLFINVPEADIQNLKLKYQTGNSYPVIGVISRYTEWKGIQYIIPAFKKILMEFPNAKLILANAQGDYSKEIKQLLTTLPENNYTEIKFENNLFALYKLFDVFVHAPIDQYSEAFGQIYVEALAASVPSIFTVSGIANDFIKNNENSLVVNYKDSEGIYLSLKELTLNKVLAEKLAKNGKNDVKNLFHISKMIQDLETIYLSKFNGN